MSAESAEEQECRRWDSSRCDGGITLTEEAATAAHGSTRWDTVLGHRWFNDGVHELEIRTDCVDNLSLFVGVVRVAHWDAAQQQHEPMRDSQHAICMHGDGRLFIKGQEKEWGLMRLRSGGQLTIKLDFCAGVVTFTQTCVVRGKTKESVAEVPGLFCEAAVAVCFGGREQQLTLGSCVCLESGGEVAEGRVRDPYSEAMGEAVAPLTLDSEGDAGLSVANQEAVVATSLY